VVASNRETDHSRAFPRRLIIESIIEDLGEKRSLFADLDEAAEAFVGKLGKTAVPVLDSTGFVVNRLLVPYLLNAINAYSQGLAPADHIDKAMKLGCGHPVGPLALSDLVGLDIVYAMAKLLYKDFGTSTYRPPALLRRLVQMGQLGRKTKLGIYDYSTKPAAPNREVWDLIRGGNLAARAA
jgi:3-hydroxybutyryl-CoA dehydrogenase